MIFFLAKSQVADLTGKIRYGAQVRALRKMGIDYRERPDGRPIVLESDVLVNPANSGRKENKMNFAAI